MTLVEMILSISLSTLFIVSVIPIWVQTSEISETERSTSIQFTEVERMARMVESFFKIVNECGHPLAYQSLPDGFQIWYQEELVLEKKGFALVVNSYYHEFGNQTILQFSSNIKFTFRVEIPDTFHFILSNEVITIDRFIYILGGINEKDYSLLSNMA